LIRAVAAALAVCALATAARADDAKPRMVDTPIGPRPVVPLPPYKPGPPEKVALDAADDANVESDGGRTGFVVAAAVGPAILVGISMDEHATGTGGGFSFRVGRVANRDTVINLELSGVVFPYTVGVGDPPMDQRRINQSVVLALGGQTWVARNFWLRGGAGLTVFTSRAEGAMFDETKTRLGGAVLGGAGIDLVRRRSLALALEVMTQVAVYRTGAIIGGGVGLSLGIF
jgi:hypothetical protein